MGIFGKSKAEKAMEATTAVASAVAVVGGVALLAWLDASASIQAEEDRRGERRARLAQAKREVEYWEHQAARLWTLGNRASYELAARELARAKREYRGV